jgi:predicted outer membrane repeat protein
VWHLNLLTNVATQLSTSNALGQTITDGSVRFVNNTALFGGGAIGVVWSLGTGTATTVATANGIAQYAPLGVAGAPVTLTGAPAGTRFYQILGTHF